MANFAGYQEVPVIRWGSLVEVDDPTQLPIGLAMISRNNRYLQQSIAPRYGLLLALKTGYADPISGLGFLKYQGNSNFHPDPVTGIGTVIPPAKIPIVYDLAGRCFIEQPQGSGTLVPINHPLLTAGCSATINTAYNNAYIAQSDLKTGVAKPLVLVGDSQTLQQASIPPIGEAWDANKAYAAGTIVSPTSTTTNKKIYRCNVAGTSGVAEPAWPGDSATVGDNGITWQECTPVIATTLVDPVMPTLTRNGAVAGGTPRNASATVTVVLGVITSVTITNGGSGYSVAPTITIFDELSGGTGSGAVLTATVTAGVVTAITIVNGGSNYNHVPSVLFSFANAFPAGKDVYVITTLVNSIGETDGLTQAPGLLVNTNAGDVATVSSPVLPSWNAALAAQYQATGYNVYAASVATGAAPPVATAFLLCNSSPIAIGTNYDVTAVPASAANAPQGNDAWITPAGNIASGTRWMIVLFDNGRYICGVTDAVPVSMNPVDDGRSLFAAKIPTGPAGTIRRICGFTVAGGSSAGPYYYIATEDKIYPNDLTQGAFIEISSTVINDNTTTSATFTFLDSYLLDETDITDCFDKAEIPPCSDIQFVKSLNRLVYTGCVGYPSGHLVSNEGDPETISIGADPDALDSEVEVAQLDGDRTVTVRELNSQVYSLKENSGHFVTPNGASPSAWDVKEAWKGAGPCGPLAIDVFNEFWVFAHTSGFYYFAGGQPVDISSDELTLTWKRINPEAKETIWVKIYPTRHEIHIGLPLDGATSPNWRVVLSVTDWSQLTQGSVVFSVRMGRLIPNPDGRKWSTEPMSTRCAAVMARDLTASVDTRIDHEQFLIAYNAGYTGFQCPDVFHDQDVNGDPIGIDWQYQSTYAPNPKLVEFALGGATWSAKGSGPLNVSGVPSSGNTAFITNQNRPCIMTNGNELVMDATARNPLSEWWSIKFDNGAVADAWAEIHHAILRLKVQFASRRS